MLVFVESSRTYLRTLVHDNTRTREDQTVNEKGVRKPWESVAADKRATNSAMIARQM